MDGRGAASSSGSGWIGLAGVIGALALLASPLTHEAIDWQPSLSASQPWRAVTAPLVHLSALHLAANLVGTLLVGLLGRMARVGRPSVVAWLLAWPLTQIALLAQPALTHYAGLSGVLHAGVAVIVVHLLFNCRGVSRLIAIGVLIGLAAKIALEAPWAHVLSHPAGWDIAVAPLAHVAGTAAGVLTATVAEIIAKRLHGR